MRLAAFLFAGVSTLTAAPNPALPLTVVLDFDHAYSTASVQTLQRELPQMFEGTPLRIDLRLKDELPASPQFGELVVFKMKGQCTMNALPIAALSDERGPLAMTYTVDGELLPFGEVECDRVRESVQRNLGRGDPERHQAAFGRALACVMAHEMYHMLAKSAQHTKDGVTRESLSGRELTEGKLTLSDKAKIAVTRQPQPH